MAESNKCGYLAVRAEDRQSVFWQSVGKFANRRRIVVAMLCLVVLAVRTSADETGRTKPLVGDLKSHVTPDTALVPRPESGDEISDAPKPLRPLEKDLAKLIEKATPLNPDQTVFLDHPGRRVIIRGEVACRNCILEMLCVPEGIKEHETILRMRSKAYVIHAGLLALGLETGKPATFSPEFQPPEGPVISVYVSWLDEDGRLQRKDVRTWIRRNIHKYYASPLPAPPPGLTMPYKELRFDKFNNDLLWFGPMSDADKADLLSKWDNPKYRSAIEKFHAESQSHEMEAEFVFIGSGFYTDPDTQEQYYKAEAGYVICVANFADALLDIREASSASDGGQAYEAWTERIPPDGTTVLLELVPVSRSKPELQKPLKCVSAAIGAAEPRTPGKKRE